MCIKLALQFSCVWNWRIRYSLPIQLVVPILVVILAPQPPKCPLPCTNTQKLAAQFSFPCINHAPVCGGGTRVTTGVQS